MNGEQLAKKCLELIENWRKVEDIDPILNCAYGECASDLDELIESWTGEK